MGGGEERKEVVDVHGGQKSRGCLVLKPSKFSANNNIAGNCDRDRGDWGMDLQYIKHGHSIFTTRLTDFR
jgi:hypothetical protein